MVSEVVIFVNNSTVLILSWFLASLRAKPQTELEFVPPFPRARKQIAFQWTHWILIIFLAMRLEWSAAVVEKEKNKGSAAQSAISQHQKTNCVSTHGEKRNRCHNYGTAVAQSQNIFFLKKKPGVAYFIGDRGDVHDYRNRRVT